MSSKACIDLFLRNSRCRGNILRRGEVLRVVSQRRFYPAVATIKKKEPSSNTDTSPEDALEQLDIIRASEHAAPYDVWTFPVQTFDLHIPGLTSRRKNSSILDHVKASFATVSNSVRNIIAMYRLAVANSFPGTKVKSPFSLQLFKVQSTPWLAPFRKMALDNYKEMMQALSSGDKKAIKKYSTAAYKEHLLKLVRARDPSNIYTWTFHGENTPCKVVSIRAVETHMGSTPPRFGNRLLVQALIKFDTQQSLQVYSKSGKLVHDGAPKRVVEYLVLQKRMWHDIPWLFRDQLYEGLEARHKMMQ